MVLDLLSITGFFIKKWKMKNFSSKSLSIIKSAIDWYSSLIDPISGDAPNEGVMMVHICLIIIIMIIEISV